MSHNVDDINTFLRNNTCTLFISVHPRRIQVGSWETAQWHHRMVVTPPQQKESDSKLESIEDYRCGH